MHCDGTESATGERQQTGRESGELLNQRRLTEQPRVSIRSALYPTGRVSPDGQEISVARGLGQGRNQQEIRGITGLSGTLVSRTAMKAYRCSPTWASWLKP